MEDVKFWATVLNSTDNPFVFAAIIALGGYMTLSKKLAEVKGPIGALSRWWNTREERRIERARKVWRAQYNADEEQKDARIADMKEQIEYLKRVLRDVREELVTANARSDRNYGLLESIDCKVGTVNSKLDHPSRLPAPRLDGDTEPMERIPAFTD